MDWFLYDNGLRHERVNRYFSAYLITENIENNKNCLVLLVYKICKKSYI